MSRPRIHNNIFKKYGRLSAIKEIEGTPYSRRILCQCQCGKEKIVNLNALLSGNTKSCGCLKKDRNRKVFTKHGLSKSNLYSVWGSIKDRCFRKNCNAYKNYGGRNISICDEWLDFRNFHKWAMDNGYRKGLTIERIDNDGDYYPENCIFISKEEQSKNRRKLHLISFNGETRTLSDWARLLNIHPSSLRDRFNNGWKIERALTTKNLKLMVSEDHPKMEVSNE